MTVDSLRAFVESRTFLGNDLWHWFLAGAAAVLTFVIVSTVLRFALGRMRRMAGHSRTHLDDALVEVLSGTNTALIALASLLVGLNMLELPDRWQQRVSQLWFIALALQFALWGGRAISLGLSRYVARHAPRSTTHTTATATLLSWGLRTVLWSVVALAILSNLGVNITAFIASLGVGGVAVALAVQNILGDLFASLSIAIDKPFEVGDFIVVGDLSGTVEYVGLKSTRIRSLGGEQIVVGNTDLLKQSIRNYKRLQERRVVFNFGITYDATPEQAEQVAEATARIVKDHPGLRFDRCHLAKFGDSSLDYELVYYVLSADYTVYMNEQQAINLELMREFKRLGVAFAFPTRTVIVAGGDPPLPPAPEPRTDRRTH